MTSPAIYVHCLIRINIVVINGFDLNNVYGIGQNIRAILRPLTNIRTAQGKTKKHTHNSTKAELDDIYTYIKEQSILEIFRVQY